MTLDDGSDDVFVYFSGIYASGHRTLEDDHDIAAEVVQRRKSPQAANGPATRGLHGRVDA